MASSEEHFDAEKAREEIFSSWRGDIWFAIDFAIAVGKKLARRRRFPDQARRFFNATIECVQDTSPLVHLLLSISDCFTETFRYSDALDYLLKLEKITSNGEDKQGKTLKGGILQLQIGSMYFHIRKFDTAIDYLLKALKIVLETGDREIEMNCYLSLGNVYTEINETERAIKYIEEALVICIDLSDRNHEGFCYTNLGTAYYSLGQLKNALEYIEKSLSIHQELGNRLDQLRDYTNLSLLYLDLGKYQRAIDYGEHCLTLSRELEAWNVFEHSCTNLGIAYLRIGQFKKAILFHEKALSTSKLLEDRLSEGKDYGNLGDAYMQLEQYEKAIEYYEKGLAINIEVKHRLSEGVMYSSLGTVYRRLGQVGKAYDYARKGLEISVEVGNQIQQSKRYTELGIILLVMGRFDEAISFHKKCREMSLQIGNIERTITSELNLGGCSFTMAASETDKDRAGRLLNDARSYFSKALRTINGVFFELVADKNKMSFVNYFSSSHMTLMYTFFKLERPEASLLAVDLGKAKALQCLVDQHQERSNQVPIDNAHNFRELTWASIDAEKEKTRLNDIFHSIQQKHAQASVLVYSFGRSGSLHIWLLHENKEGPKCTTITSNLEKTTLLDDLESLLSGVYRKLRRNFFYFSTHPYSEVGNVDVIPPNIFSNLTCSSESGVSNSIGVSYLEESSIKQTATSEQSHPNNGISCHESAVGISRSLEAASKKAPERNETIPIADENDSDKLKALYKRLIDPVKYSIVGRKLIIVPDDMLFFVPFCSLLDENGRPLSETYSIQMTPSLHILASSIEVTRTSNFGPALFVGNPSVGEVCFSGQSYTIESLPCAEEEVISLAKHFEAKPLVEKQATKRRVLQCLPDASIIHIAAHGEAGCGEVFLAPDAVSDTTGLPRERDYLLRQGDVIDLQLNARLVVLSCCHTGRGLVSPEGVVGLARSFLGAGARSVLVALWPIPDDDTKLFMECFYNEICKQTGVCEALKMAMNTFQKSTNVEQRSFRTWAPFTIFGEDVSFTKEDIDEIRRRSRESSV